ncbi:MAG: Thiamin-phosphate pyrophosphorylase [Ignavibacteriae bacterium]|nr:MAG: Thiamin-phosphate pyrophosphorylase [Ignavibacteriota bacterium]
MKKKFDLSLYLVTDRKIIGQKNIFDVITAAIKGGVSAIQLREKDCSTREFIELAREVKKIVSKFEIPLIINDRIDVAEVVQADGVHIGQSDMLYSDARTLLGYNSIIGISVENMSQAQEAISSDVDYVSISPVFLTPTKPEAQNFWGVDGLKEIRRLTDKYLVAIGGINATNVERVLTAGADGIAVVSAICASDDPENAARELKTIINKYKKAYENY